MQVSDLMVLEKLGDLRHRAEHCKLNQRSRGRMTHVRKREREKEKEKEEQKK